MYKYLLIVLLLTPFTASKLQAAPSADLWPRWEAHDAQNQTRIDHRDWAAMLRTYLYSAADGISRFAYGKVSEDDHSRLVGYLEQMSRINISEYNRDVQRAYWINLYNALTVREILRVYPVDSIRDISPRLFSIGPWNSDLIEIEGGEAYPERHRASHSAPDLEGRAYPLRAQLCITRLP
jgi:hypothetical protein